MSLNDCLSIKIHAKIQKKAVSVSKNAYLDGKLMRFTEAAANEMHT